MELLKLPQELLGHILIYLRPADIVRFGRSCRRAHSFIDPSNQLLWQSAFLQLFDDPQEAWAHLTPTARRLNAAVEERWDWYARLRQRAIALQAIDDVWTLAMLDNPPSHADTIAVILDLIETARPAPTEAEVKRGVALEIDDRSSLNLALLPTRYNYSARLDLLLRGPHNQSSRLGSQPFDPGLSPKLCHLPGRPTTRSLAFAPNQGPRLEAACKLHVLAGVTQLESQDARALGAARRSVYDWNITDEGNDYGPFKRDGNVDWQRLEAVVSVATGHFSRAVQGRLLLPQGFGYSIPFRTLVDTSYPDDWAGITGSWCGTYVFLNWEDLRRFNTITNVLGRPSLEDGPESCGGLMKMELKLDEGLKEDVKLQSNLPICEDLPPLYFSGISNSWAFQLPNGVRGMACLTANGKQVRWRLIVSYNGADQWQLEGVQPGGIRSGPLYGLWTGCDHEEAGPVGPFIYAPDELCKTTAVVLHS